MTSIDPAQLRRIFDLAAETPSARRDEFVRESCGEDAELAREVFSLLRSLDSQWVSDLDSPPTAPPIIAGSGTPSGEPRAASISGFRLVRLIGRGAMGSVYEAEQDSPRRKVAFKVLHVWNARQDLRRRLVAEAQILARLDHPGIARVIAAGTYDLSACDTGGAMRELLGPSATAPWIAMELVENARSLADHAREQGLSIPARIELIARVCDAVHYGHTKGVIHRDLKPANVLVNAMGQPKVIDFGVARALGHSADATLHATIADGSQLVGTVRYMSPEQCDGRAQHADVRSDTYALGVLAFELLTGHFPYQLDPDSFVASARTICEAPPKRPGSLVPGLDPDIDVVLLKALRKEPEARYQSAAELAADFRRVLANEPIRAREPSLAYSARKWIRRNPGRAALAAAALIGLCAGIGGIVVGLTREQAARALADRQSRQANLMAADFAVRFGDAGTAMDRLHAIPESLRGWEWDVIRASADTSTGQIDLTSTAGPGGTCLITPDPALVLALSNDSVRGIELPARRERWRVALKPSRSAAAFSADGRTALVPGMGESVLLSLDSGTAARRFPHPLDVPAYGGTVDPGNRFVAVAGSGFISVYDITTGQTRRSWSSAGSVYNASFDPTGDRLAWSDTDAMVIVSTADWSTLQRIPTARPTIWEPSFVSWAPDGTLIACTEGRDVMLYDALNAAPPRRLAGAGQRIEAVAFSPDSALVLAGSRDSTLRAWDARSGTLLRTCIGHGATVRGLAITSPGGSPLLVRSIDAREVARDWAVTAAATLPRYTVSAGPNGAFVDAVSLGSDSGDIIAAAHGGALERLGTPPTPNLSLAADGVLTHAAFSTDRTVATTTWRDGRVRIVGLSPPTIRASLTVGAEPTACVMSPDGRVAAIGTARGSVVLLSVAGGEQQGSLGTEASKVERLAMHPGGELLAVSRQDGSLELWDLSSRTLLRTVRVPTPNSFVSCSFSGDGRWLASSDSSRDEVRVEPVRGGSARWISPDLRTTVWSLAFSPDGSRLAIGGQDSLVRICDASSGDELLILRDHIGSVMSLVWSADGSTLATGGFDRRVFVYRAASTAAPSAHTTTEAGR